ncbi:Imm26 family immunity protein [Pseudomonas sp.]|uniref:Imm26 family immunity protein n=1 Tax=Pseudomonas sp. TaxID=306 RepID=UPI0028B16B93|nr:Imm26 family immunity protein [Pseudomonas sp.]
MEIKFQKWANKPKTLLRYVKPGDLFCFSSKGGVFYFGRIMTKNSLGHVAEVFCEQASTPDASLLSSFKRLGRPLILDSYGLFDRKSEGDWRIVGHQPGYAAPTDELIYFTYGVGPFCKRVDQFDREVAISAEAAKTYETYSPMGDADVKEALGIV